MFQFSVNLLSRYRTHLMGFATLLILFGHSKGNGVLMPGWMQSLCGLASVGVDIFLLVSGLGLWYSLNSQKNNLLATPPIQSLNLYGVSKWYHRRYKRILIPYFLIAGLAAVLQVYRGDDVFSVLLKFSTLDYWLHHRGAWYIAMLIPLYAFTPIYNLVCKRIEYSKTFQLFFVFLLVALMDCHCHFQLPILNNVVENIRFVLYHLPAFFIGFFLAPYAKENKSISVLYMFLLPVVVLIAMVTYKFGYWPGLIVFPLVVILCRLFQYTSTLIMTMLDFFGKISLESYLFNGVMGSWIVFYLPSLYESELNYGNYLFYALVLVLGTISAFLVHKFCDLFFYSKK